MADEIGRKAIGRVSRPQTRKVPSNRVMTAAKREAFVEVLADTCNFAASARATGVKEGTAWQLWKRNPEFRRACDEARAIGYVRLELALLERALAGEDVPTGKDGSATIRRYPDKTALCLLAANRQSQAAERTGRNLAKPDDEGAVDALLAKLDEMAERIAAGEADA